MVEWFEDLDYGAEGLGFESLSVNPGVIEYLLLESRRDENRRLYAVSNIRQAYCH